MREPQFSQEISYFWNDAEISDRIQEARPGTTQTSTWPPALPIKRLEFQPFEHINPPVVAIFFTKEKLIFYLKIYRDKIIGPLCVL